MGYLTKVRNQYSWVDDSHKSIGSVLARFERSTRPDHEGTRTIVLRFLKIITPVRCVMSYDGYIKQPTEGGLYQKGGKIWSIDIDNSKCVRLNPGLQSLWQS
jgi:hypothetical protein